MCCGGACCAPQSICCDDVCRSEHLAYDPARWGAAKCCNGYYIINQGYIPPTPWGENNGDCCGGVVYGAPIAVLYPVPFVPFVWQNGQCPAGYVYARWGENGGCCGCIPEEIYDPRDGGGYRPAEEVVGELCCPSCGGQWLPFDEEGVPTACLQRCCVDGVCTDMTPAQCAAAEGELLPGCCTLGCDIPCCSEVDCNSSCSQVPSSICASPASPADCETGCLGACCVDGVYVGQTTQAGCAGCWSGLGSTTCVGVCLDGGGCCESVQSTASGLTFTRPTTQHNRCRNCPAASGTQRVTVTGFTDSSILIHGTPFGAAGKRCPINHTFLLCWPSFNIEPVACDSNFQLLDITVCWEDEATTVETLKFSGCSDITVHLGECDHACVTTLLYEGTGATSSADIVLHGNAVIEANGSGPLVLTEPITNEGACVETLTLTGTSTEANEVRVIQDSSSGLDVEKRGVGLWRLNGASTYSGQLKVLDGTLVVASNVFAAGGSPFGMSSGRPVVGSVAAVSGTAAMLVAGGVTVTRDVSVAGPSTSSQVAVLGAAGTGTAIIGNNATELRLGRSVTLQAADTATADFRGVWLDGDGNPTPSVGFTVGSDGNGGTVLLKSEFPTTVTSLAIVNGTARLATLADDQIWPETPVTVGSILGEATLDINGKSQSLESLTFDGEDGSVIGGTLHLAGVPVVTVSGVGHEVSSSVAVDSGATFTGSGDLLISGVISGAGEITKDGGGTVELSNNNTRTGQTTINAGTMRALHVNAFGTGAIVVNSGGTLDKNGYALANTITNNGGTVLN